MTTRWGQKGTIILIIWAISWVLGFVPMAMPAGVWPNSIEPRVIGIPAMMVWWFFTLFISFICTTTLCYMNSNTKAEDM